MCAPSTSALRFFQLKLVKQAGAQTYFGTASGSRETGIQRKRRPREAAHGHVALPRTARRPRTVTDNLHVDHQPALPPSLSFIRPIPHHV